METTSLLHVKLVLQTVPAVWEVPPVLNAIRDSILRLVPVWEDAQQDITWTLPIQSVELACQPVVTALTSTSVWIAKPSITCSPMVPRRYVLQIVVKDFMKTTV